MYLMCASVLMHDEQNITFIGFAVDAAMDETMNGDSEDLNSDN